MIVAISGLLEDSHGNKRIAGAGKDEAAKILIENGFVSIAFADEMKRFCQRVYGFTDEQCWGPSEERVRPDKRYPRNHTWGPNGPCACCGWDPNTLVRDGSAPPQCYLTSRYALQLLGTEWGRHCFLDTWVMLALRDANEVLVNGRQYDHVYGVYNEHEYVAPIRTYIGAVLPDTRFQNEFNSVREAGGKIIRVKRKCDEFPSKLDDSHVSERDILAWDDDKFDYIIDNSRDPHYLKMQVDRALSCFSGRIIPYDDEQKDIPPFKRKKK